MRRILKPMGVFLEAFLIGECSINVGEEKKRPIYWLDFHF